MLNSHYMEKPSWNLKTITNAWNPTCSDFQSRVGPGDFDVKEN